MIDNVYTVSQVNNYIKGMFARERAFAQIAVKGEASNVKYHSSGHIYFTLKDESGQMSCVMFSSQRSGLTFRLEEGLGIVVVGQISVYERDGRYQIYAKQILLEGRGRLYEEFEKLKKRLGAEGLFDIAHKKPIPAFAKTVGIVTAATGAALQDIINIATRRNPYIQLILSPSLVQGEEAPKSIANALKLLEGYKPDVIIVGRGGGSIEDLFAFNDEVVAKAIYECEIPVISAVGHETDFTIADFVSDLRAPTPSAAAELAVADISAVLSTLVDYRYDLNKAMNDIIERKRKDLLLIKTRLSANSPRSKLETERQYLFELTDKLSYHMKKALSDKRHSLEILTERLEGLSPLRKLSGGYAFASDEKGRALLSVDDISANDIIKVSLLDGDIDARVISSIKKEERGRNGRK